MYLTGAAFIKSERFALRTKIDRNQHLRKGQTPILRCGLGYLIRVGGTSYLNRGRNKGHFRNKSFSHKVADLSGRIEKFFGGLFWE